MTTKKCSSCGEVKDNSQFNSDKTKTSGLSSHCKTCFSARSKARYERTKEKIAAERKEYYERNKDKIKARRNSRYAEDPTTVIGTNKKYYEKNKEVVSKRQKAYFERNREKFARLGIEYRARKMQAQADWDEELTKFVTEEAKDLCWKREEITGFKWHIDHVVPLKGRTVCGLHVWNNLAVIPASENLRKRNKWPN